MGGKSTAPAVKPAPGEDNNKRLAFLESRVELLIGAATSVIARYAPTLELAPKDGNEDLFDVQIRLLEEVATQPEPDATPGEIAAIKRAEAAEGELAKTKLELAELKIDVEELASAKNALAAKIGELESGAPPAAADPETPEELPAPIVRERPEGARDFGPTFGQADRGDIEEAIGNDAAFEVAFSNGEYEIVDFEPVRIEGRSLEPVEGKRMVGRPIVIRGGVAREDIHGAALLLNGEQIAYCPFPEPIPVEPGQDRQFSRAIVF